MKRTVNVSYETKSKPPKMVGLLRLEHVKENYDKIARFREFLEGRDQEHECAVEKSPNTGRYFYFFRVPAGTDTKAIKADWSKTGLELPAEIDTDGEEVEGSDGE